VIHIFQAAEAKWRDRVGGIETITVIAMVRRLAGDAKPDFREWLRCVEWEAPVVEVTSRG
jgi:hypothetical protein